LATVFSFLVWSCVVKGRPIEVNGPPDAGILARAAHHSTPQRGTAGSCGLPADAAAR
jgi:hypothetical protein